MTGDHALARRVALGTATNMVGQGVALATTIALVPIIVHAVGVKDYAVWVLVGNVASFAFLLDMGISAGLVKFVAEHAARAEIDEGSRIVGAATWLYAVLGLGIFIVGLLLALVLPAILGLHGEDGRLAQSLTTVVALDVGISIPAIAPLAVLRGLQRFPVVNAILGGGAVLGGLLIVGTLAAGGGIVGVAAVSALNSALTYCASIVVARRIAPGYVRGPIRRDRARVRRLIRFSRSIAAVQVAVRMQGRLDALIIAAALPVTLVTPYNFAQRLADGTRIAVDQFGKVLLPLATEVGATREPNAMGALFLTATRLTLGIALAVGLPLVLLGGPVLELWVGAEFANYGGLVALLTLAAIVDLPSYPAAAVLQSLERHAPIAWIALGSGVANLGLSIALVGPYGVHGVAAATLVASAVEIVLFILPYSARVLGVSLRNFFSQVVLRLALPVIGFTGLLLGGAALVPVTSLLRLALVVGAALTGYALAYAALGATPRERDAYRSAGSAVLRLAVPARVRRSRRS